MKFFIFALATVFASLLAQEKAEDNCPGECPCSPFHCSVESLMTAAELLYQNWCTIIDNQSLNQLQGLITKDSTLQFIAQNGQDCIDTGSVNYLENIIPLMPYLECQQGVVANVSMEGKSKVVVIGYNELNLGIESVEFKIRQVFKVVNGCELKLAESEVIQDDCVLFPTDA